MGLFETSQNDPHLLNLQRLRIMMTLTAVLSIPWGIMAELNGNAFDPFFVRVIMAVVLLLTAWSLNQTEWLRQNAERIYLVLMLGATGWNTYLVSASGLDTQRTFGHFMFVALTGLALDERRHLFIYFLANSVFALFAGPGRPLADRFFFAAFVPTAGILCTFALTSRLRLIEELKRSHQESLLTLNEVRTAQAQLVQSSKFKALGEMAGGIAHEINNPLCALEILVSLIQRMMATASPGNPPDPAKIAALAKQSQDIVRRITLIVSGLRRFSRDGEREPLTDIAIPKLIEETLSLCQARFRDSGVSLVVEPMTPGLSIRGHSVHLAQVVLNLVGNAIDAVEGTDRKEVHVGAYRTGQGVEIRVSDSGPGIPPEIRERVFEPFFTTKPVGQGTGLGLSISAGIVHEHGGELRLVTADPGLSTCFALSLPAEAPYGHA